LDVRIKYRLFPFFDSQPIVGKKCEVLNCEPSLAIAIIRIDARLLLPLELRLLGVTGDKEFKLLRDALLLKIPDIVSGLVVRIQV
jgi:hypothetical protein